MNRKKSVPLEERLHRENLHGQVILQANEENWGWHTSAGKLRKQRREQFLAKKAEIDATDLRVLEVGCGTGTFTGALSRGYPALTSIDISDALLDHARSRFPQVRFQRQDIHRTSFPDASFDLVVGCSVLHHLDWDLALREIHRLLRPGGRIRFSEPNLLNPQIFVQKNWPWLKRRLGDSPDEYAFTPATIRRSLASAGFADISAEPYEFLHPSTPLALIPAVLRIEALLERSPLGAIAGSIRITATRP